MKIELAAPVTRGGGEDVRDIRQVKRVLVCTGFYIPDPADGITGEAEPGFWTALHAFQRAHMIPFADTAGPGSVTENIMNEQLAALEESGGTYIWRTAGDEKVRPEHAARDGRQYRWDDPPDGENPTEDYNCRCWAEPVSPSRHPLAEEARAAQVERMAPALGVKVPDPVLTQPGLDAINPSIGPVEILAGGVIARVGGRAALSALRKILADRKQPEQLPAKTTPNDPALKKPEGIPDDWIVTKTKKGTGVQYTSPADPRKGTYVKVEKANPNSPQPGQRYDNVRWQKNGASFDVDGNVVLKRSKESHIPIEDFKFDLEKMK